VICPDLFLFSFCKQAPCFLFLTTRNLNTDCSGTTKGGKIRSSRTNILIREKDRDVSLLQIHFCHIGFKTTVRRDSDHIIKIGHFIFLRTIKLSSEERKERKNFPALKLGFASRIASYSEHSDFISRDIRERTASSAGYSS